MAKTRPYINGNRLDNRIENLKIVSPSEHTSLHKLWEKRKCQKESV